MNNLAKKIKQYRIDNKITQVELSEKLQVDQAYVSRWEQGVIPREKNLHNIARLLGIKKDLLFASQESLKKIHENFATNIIAIKKQRISDLMKRLDSEIKDLNDLL